MALAELLLFRFILCTDIAQEEGIVSLTETVPYEAGKFGKTKTIETTVKGGVAGMVEETIKSIRETESKADQIVKEAEQKSKAVIEDAKKEAQQAAEQIIATARAEALKIAEQAKENGEAASARAAEETQKEAKQMKEAALKREDEAVALVLERLI